MTDNADRVYLDYNATAPLRSEAREAMLQAMACGGNPSSPHRAGRAARRLVEEARAEVAALAGAPEDAVVFTSGATEANALALCGFRGATAGVIFPSAVEHPSVRENADGANPLAVDGDGVVDLAALEETLRAAAGRPVLAAVLAVNNETGVVQPIERVAAIAAQTGAALHLDAVQAAGRLPLDFAASGAASMSLSAHKIGGPTGVGALILAANARIAPLQRGGGQERGLRAGTENIIGIAGFGAAAAEARREANDAQAQNRLRELRDDMEARLRAIRPAVVFPGARAARVANSSCIALPGTVAETLVPALDLAGVMVGAGAACSSGKVRQSPVLRAMGHDADIAAAAIRVSTGYANVAADIDRFIDAWAAATARMTASG